MIHRVGKECRSLLRQQPAFSKARHGQPSSIWLQRARLVCAPRTFALWALFPGCECLSMLKCSIRAIQFVALFQHSAFCVICTCHLCQGLLHSSDGFSLQVWAGDRILWQLGIKGLLGNAMQQGMQRLCVGFSIGHGRPRSTATIRQQCNGRVQNVNCRLIFQR